MLPAITSHNAVSHVGQPPEPVQDVNGEGWPIGITPANAQYCDYFAAPAIASSTSAAGLPGNPGTILEPWDLQTALNKVSELNGKTLGIMPTTDGTVSIINGVPQPMLHNPYRGKFKSTLVNARVIGLTIRPAGLPRIDGYLYTTLTADINASVTAIPVANASLFASAINSGAANSVVVDGEVLFVNSIVGNVINVNRAASGSSTAAVAHLSGAAVRLASNTFIVAGNNTTYMNFEVMSSEPLRNWNTSGAEGIRGSGIFNPGSLGSYGDGNKFIDLFVRDNLNGIFCGSGSSNTTVDGCLVINNGVFDDSAEGKGHGMYLENDHGYSRIYNNIVLNNFGLGTQLFGVSAAYPGGDIQGNVFANSGSPIGVLHRNIVMGPNIQRIPDILVQNNFFVHPHTAANAYNVLFGYGAGATNGSLLTNYFIGGGAIGLEITNTTNVTVTGNKFYTTHPQGVNISVPLNSHYTINSNTYYGTATADDKFGVDTVGHEVFSLWKSSTGNDAASTSTSAAIPVTVKVLPSAYQAGRANIIVVCPAGTTSVTFDLANTGMPVGHTFALKNAFYFDGADVVTGVYAGGSQIVTIPLNSAASTAVATPIGSSFTPATMCPSFGCFLLMSGGTP